MESLALSNVSVLANTVSINAVAATKVAGVRTAKPTRALHTPAMVNHQRKKIIKNKLYRYEK